jgi:hypothetical protein
MNVTYKILILVIAFYVINMYAEKLKLITVLYNETHPQRMQEYITCLEKNLQHPSIDKIIILYDTTKDDAINALFEYLKTKEVEIIFIKGRPSFASCFRLANELFPQNKVILSNADIYFNETLTQLEEYDLSKKFLAITRKELGVQGNLCYMRSWPARYGSSEASQDVWIFSTPVFIPKREDILLGTWHCESEIAFQAVHHGLKVINPYFSIDCIHLHLSQVRHYNQRAYPRSQTYVTTLSTLS